MSSRRRRLETTVAAIQQRWGLRALRRLDSAAETTVLHISTGFPALDRVLKIGGVPRGFVTELIGAPTSGMSTLALRVIANAQNGGDVVAYIDLDRSFDPDYAARCGVCLEQLLLVRPPGGQEGLEITCNLVARGGVGALIFDAASNLAAGPHGGENVSTAMRRLVAALRGSVCAPVFLTPLLAGPAGSVSHRSEGHPLSQCAAVRLLIEKEQWILKRRDVMGYRARVSVLKNDFGPSGKSVAIAITFDGVVQGHGT